MLLTPSWLGGNATLRHRLAANASVVVDAWAGTDLQRLELKAGATAGVRVTW